MARKTNDDMLMEDELAAAFLEDDATTMLEPDEPTLAAPEEEGLAAPEEEEQVEPSEEGDDGWETGDDFPGQLAVDVYETADKLVIKARTAGIKKSDLNVSIHDSILPFPASSAVAKTTKLPAGTSKNVIGASSLALSLSLSPSARTKTASRPSFAMAS